MFFSVVVFIISGLIFFRLLNNIFDRQLDETLLEEKLLIEQSINYSDSVPDFRSVFGHMIDITILIAPHKKVEWIRDTVMYDSDKGEFASFRHLFVKNTSFKKQGYIINIYKPLRESENLIAEIVIAIAMLFISLLFLLILVNYFISRRVWIPFYRTLNVLSQYEINQEKPLKFALSDIHEFELLNDTLERMSKKIRQDYLNLKEFNENAAHELQTPLAIIKSKLELLIQSEDLDEHQFQLISSVFEATSRMAKLNQGLLLISKIDNNQFPQTEQVNLIPLIEKTLSHFDEIIKHRNISVTKDFIDPVAIKMNAALAEILITNLISNAVKHNISPGSINIKVNREMLTISNSGNQLQTDPQQFFERFRKSDHHSDSVGLGLSIVQKITYLYNMRVEYTYNNLTHSLKIYF